MLCRSMKITQTARPPAEDMMKAYQGVQKLPANIISNVLVLLVHAAAGLCANYLYAKKAEKGVYEIRKLSQNPEQYRISLFRSGGISFFWLMASVLLSFACTNALSIVLARFLIVKTIAYPIKTGDEIL